MTTYTLWAGPHDGLDVDIPSGHLQHSVPYKIGPAGAERTLNALYLWSNSRKRFEWERFDNLP